MVFYLRNTILYQLCFTYWYTDPAIVYLMHSAGETAHTKEQRMDWMKEIKETILWHFVFYGGWYIAGAVCAGVVAIIVLT